MRLWLRPEIRRQRNSRRAAFSCLVLFRGRRTFEAHCECLDVPSRRSIGSEIGDQGGLDALGLQLIGRLPGLEVAVQTLNLIS